MNIAVGDINDQAPQFDEDYSVVEIVNTNSPGQQITTFTASDEDGDGVNSIVRFELATQRIGKHSLHKILCDVVFVGIQQKSF